MAVQTIDKKSQNIGAEAMASQPAALEIRNVSVWYGDHLAVKDVSLTIPERSITAIIGPSGCGKSTLLRTLNRMNDFVPQARVEGQVLYGGKNVYDPDVDPAELRLRIGMIFQKPNPFPKSIFDNVAFGLRINGYKGDIAARVEESLKKAALWDEVKTKLNENALNLSGGQQQRLCIARALAISPHVLLMDEPCSALDPQSTFRIEDLMRELREQYAIVIVTHNMQQAARVSDYTVFMLAGEERTGELIEVGKTEQVFETPKDPRTEQYVTGRFG